MGTHTFERFIENRGKLEVSLKDRIDELETVFECSNIENGKQVKVNYKNTGKHLLCIEYSANASSISQFVITIKINDKINMNMTVRGTEETVKQVYVDFTAHSNEGNIIFSFPQIVQIYRVIVMK